MTSRKNFSAMWPKAMGILAALFAVCMSGSVASADKSAPSALAPKTIRWVLAHEPVRVFERAAKQFKEQVERESKGSLRVEVLTATEYTKRYKVDASFMQNGLINGRKLVQTGRAEMTQTYTSELGGLDKRIWVLDLPFLFRDHAHAQAVLEGPIGQRLLARLDRAKMKAFAFTYSGGYRVISSRERGIASVEDFKGMAIRTSPNPVAQATFRQLGAKPVPMPHDEGIEQVKKGSIIAAETTIARFDDAQQKATPIMNDTQHSLFLTTMLMNGSFFKQLSPEHQGIVERAAVAAARAEREDSLTDEAQLRSSFAKSGVKVVRLPASEVEKMREKTRPVYKEFESVFTPELIAEIQNTKAN
jgi:TRAP-type C4-dicarboxylate transport system substrate-binding protein